MIINDESFLYSLKITNWFQNKNANIFECEIYDQAEFNEDFKIALLRINKEFIYLAFLDKDNCIVNQNENIIFEYLFKYLQNNDKLPTQKGFIKYTQYNNNLKIEYPIKQFNSESTNTLFYTENYVFKLIRRLEKGECIEDKLLFLLNDLENTPKIFGNLYWQINNKHFIFGLQIENIQNNGNAWNWLLEQFSELQKTNYSANSIQLLENSFEDIGRNLAIFHNYIYDSSNTVFDVQDFTENDLNELKINIINLSKNTKYTQKIQEFINKRISQIKFYGLKFKQHGDFHLGQILHTQTGFKIIDFEGQPTTSLTERWKTNSPLQDISSLIRSIQYAKAVFYKENNIDLKNITDNLANKFLFVYKQIIHFPLPESFIYMFELYILLKVLEELDYEIKTRPQMAWIPESAIEKILNKEY